MGIRRGNRAIIGWGKRVRKSLEKKKKAKAREETRAKRKAKQKHAKEFRKFISEQRRKTKIENN